MKVTLTQVSRKERISKSGRPFTSLAIKTQEHGERWLSGFNNKDTAHWKIGDCVDIEPEQKGEYLNFKVPQRQIETNDTLRTIRLEQMQQTDTLKLIYAMLKEILDKSSNPDDFDSPPSPFEYPEPEHGEDKPEF